MNVCVTRVAVIARSFLSSIFFSPVWREENCTSFHLTSHCSRKKGNIKLECISSFSPEFSQWVFKRKVIRTGGFQLLETKKIYYTAPDLLNPFAFRQKWGAFSAHLQGNFCFPLLFTQVTNGWGEGAFYTWKDLLLVRNGELLAFHIEWEKNYAVSYLFVCVGAGVLKMHCALLLDVTRGKNNMWLFYYYFDSDAISYCYIIILIILESAQRFFRGFIPVSSFSG